MDMCPKCFQMTLFLTFLKISVISLYFFDLYYIIPLNKEILQYKNGI